MLYTVKNLDNFPNDIPLGTSSLRFKGGLINKNGDELAQTLAAIPASVTSLNLSNNGLGKKSVDELVQVLTKILPTVTFINLGDNAIFIGKTPKERDVLIDRFQSINTHGRLGLENNGEKAVIRAASLLIGMRRNGIFNQRNIPLEVINEFAYWLGASDKCFFKSNTFRKCTQRIQTTDSVRLVETQDSKMNESDLSFLAPRRSARLKQLALTAEAIELPARERPKRGRGFIEQAVEMELESPQETKRFKH